MGARPPTALRRSRVWGWTALLLVLTAAALVLFYHRWRQTGFEWEIFASSFLELRWPWVAAAGLMCMATYYGRALRWRVLLKPLRPDPNIWGLFSATAIGFTAIVLLGRPGELVRPYLISVKERVPLSSQLAAWLLERIYDLLAVLVVFGFALTQVDTARATLGPGLHWVLQTGGYLVATISGVCLVVLFLLQQFSEPMRQRLLDGLAFLPPAHLRRAERVVTAFVNGLGSTKRGDTLIRLALYTVLEWVLIFGCFFCLFKAYRQTAGFTVVEILVFMGFASLGTIVQIPGVGGGMQIVSVLVLTELFGIPLEVATSIAILIWITTFVIIVPFGLGLSFHEGLSWTKLRELEREAKI